MLLQDSLWGRDTDKYSHKILLINKRDVIYGYCLMNLYKHAMSSLSAHQPHL